VLSRVQRAALVSVAAQVSALLEQDDAEHAASANAKVATTDPATCAHPDDRLIAAPGMGNINAKLCGSCGARVEG
jgi:hypothetical protein